MKNNAYYLGAIAALTETLETRGMSDLELLQHNPTTLCSTFKGRRNGEACIAKAYNMTLGGGGVDTARTIMRMEQAWNDEVAVITKASELSRKMYPDQETLFPTILDHFHSKSDEWGDMFVTVMSFLEVPSLAQFLEENKAPLSIDQTSALLRGGARCLHVLSEIGIIHRDLKPQNILFDGKRAAIIDFNLSRPEGVSVMTMIDPDQWWCYPLDASKIRPNPNIDIYALGFIAICALLGKTPLEIIDLSDGTGECFLDTTSPNLRIPKSLRPILEKMTARNPNDRYDSPEILLEALDIAPTKAIEQKTTPAAPSATRPGSRFGLISVDGKLMEVRYEPDGKINSTSALII